MTNTPVFLLLRLWELSGQVKFFLCFIEKESMHLATAAVWVWPQFLMAWRLYDCILAALPVRCFTEVFVGFA